MGHAATKSNLISLAREKGYIATPMRHMQPDLLQAITDESQRIHLTRIIDLIRTILEIEDNEARRRMDVQYAPFSVRESEKEHIRKPKPPSDLLKYERNFMEDLFRLTKGAHYSLLTKDEWNAARSENFIMTLPIHIQWDKLDGRFIERYLKGRTGAEHFKNKLLMFQRGVGESQQTGIFLLEKLDLIVEYLIASPIKSAVLSLWPKKSKVKSSNLTIKDSYKVERSTLRTCLPSTWEILVNMFNKVTLVEPTFESTIIIYKNMDKKDGVKIVTETKEPKVKKLMPGTKMIVKFIEAKELSEKEKMGKMDPYIKALCSSGHAFTSKVCKKSNQTPKWNEETEFPLKSFQDTLTIKVWDKDQFSSDDLIGEVNLLTWNFVDRDPRVEWFTLVKKGKPAGKISLEIEVVDPSLFLEKTAMPQPINIKSFRDIPMADLELLFPQKDIHFRLFDKLKIFIFMLIAMAAIGSKVFGAWETEGWMFLAIICGVLVFQAMKIWKMMTDAKLLMEQTILSSLFDKSCETDEGCILAAFEAMLEQDLKEAILAYFFLLQKPKGLLQEDLDRIIEKYLLDTYGLNTDFDVEDACGKLCRLGLAQKMTGNSFRPVPLSADLVKKLEKYVTEICGHRHTLDKPIK